MGSGSSYDIAPQQLDRSTTKRRLPAWLIGAMIGGAAWVTAMLAIPISQSSSAGSISLPAHCRLGSQLICVFIAAPIHIGDWTGLLDYCCAVGMYAGAGAIAGYMLSVKWHWHFSVRMLLLVTMFTSIVLGIIVTAF